MKVWQYTFRSEGVGEGWAYIIIREDGFFSAVSDYGNYAFLWTHTGCDDVREFFLTAERDWHYFAKKLRPEEHLNAEKSFQALKDQILERRRDGSLGKQEARTIWGHIQYYASDDDWEGFVRDEDISDYFDSPWEYAVRELCPDVVAFAQKVLPRLAKTIQEDLVRDQRKSMSHQIRSLRIIFAQGLSISIPKWEELGRALEKKNLLPEGHLFQQEWVDQTCELRGNKLYPNEIWWDGEGSGNLETVLEVLREFDGTADIAIVWDRGEITGHHLESHQTTARKVRLALFE